MKTATIRKCAVTAIVLICSVSAALSMFAFAARFWWIFELLTHLRAHYLFALVFGAAIFAALLRFKLAAVFSVFAIINLCFVLPLYLPESRNRADGRPIRLMSVNGYHYNPTRQNLISLIRDIQPDVVLVLEVDDAWVKDLELLADSYPHRHYEPRNTHDMGIALLSRLPLHDLQVRQFGLPDIPSFAARFEDHNKNSFHLIGTHLVPPLSASGAAIRNAEFIHIASCVQTLTGPIVVGGDLNCTSWSPNFRDFLNGTGLRDSRNGFGIQSTHPGRLAPIGIAIDHVLVTDDISVRARTVGPYIGSDHRPVIVDLVISGAAKRLSE